MSYLWFGIKDNLIYMSVSNYDSNKQLMKYIQDHIQNMKNYFILGDLNGHIGILGPQPLKKWWTDVGSY